MYVLTSKGIIFVHFLLVFCGVLNLTKIVYMETMRTKASRRQFLIHVRLIGELMFFHDQIENISKEIPAVSTKHQQCQLL